MGLGDREGTPLTPREDFLPQTEVPDGVVPACNKASTSTSSPGMPLRCPNPSDREWSRNKKKKKQTPGLPIPFPHPVLKVSDGRQATPGIIRNASLKDQGWGQ